MGLEAYSTVQKERDPQIQELEKTVNKAINKVLEKKEINNTSSETDIKTVTLEQAMKELLNCNNQ